MIQVPSHNMRPFKLCWALYPPADAVGSKPGLNLTADMAIQMVVCAVTSDCEHRAMCSEMALEHPWPLAKW